MTGFAALSREAEGEKVSVTVKSVNHRFLDLAIRAPQALAPVEARIRALVQQRVTRGRVELSVAAEVSTPPPREVVIDETLVERLMAALEPLRLRGVVSGALTPSDLLRIPQVVDIRTRPVDGAASALPASLVELVVQCVADALDALVGMRETEGRFLASDLQARLDVMRGFVDRLEQASGEGQRTLEVRLRERLAALPADLQGEPAAVGQEIVRVIARSDIDEELVRLRSHFEHWRRLAEGPEPCGRKLDFLVQEMNREINTIGSKAEGVTASELVIAAKSELERIREQAQNVE
jgi:uncharacterized protein (TIGR00255 family)